MDLAYQIANYLANANYGVLGTSIFVGEMPDSTNGLCVVRSGGILNTYIPIEETVLDVYCYNQSSATAIANLEAVKRYIHRMVDTEASGVKIYSILAISDIDDVSRDGNNIKIYKITLELRHRATALLS